MTKTVIITAKPSITRTMVPFLAAGDCPWAGDELVLVQTMYIGPFQFHYPRGQAWKDFPLIAEPAYKLRQDGSIRPMRQNGASMEPMEEADGWEALAEADRIVYAADPSHTEVHVAKLMLAHVSRAADIDQVQAVWLYSLSGEDIRQAIQGSRTMHLGEVQNLLDYAEAKRHFEYNWNLNAQAVLGRSLRRVGIGDAPIRVPSKLGLQVLYHLRKTRDEVVTESDLLRAMESGAIGTGRYESKDCRNTFGSAASRGAILAQLEEDGLVERYERGTQVRNAAFLTEAGKAHYLKTLRDLAAEIPTTEELAQVEGRPNFALRLASLMKSRGEIPTFEVGPLVERGLAEMKPYPFNLGADLKPSALGSAFLESLHPDCEDLDLAYRLHLWCLEGTSARPEIDRYIRTFFGKQKRFNQKGH